MTKEELIKEIRDIYARIFDADAAKSAVLHLLEKERGSNNAGPLSADLTFPDGNRWKLFTSDTEEGRREFLYAARNHCLVGGGAINVKGLACDEHDFHAWISQSLQTAKWGRGSLMRLALEEANRLIATGEWYGEMPK